MSWWNNNNVSPIYEKVLKYKMWWNHRLYAKKAKKAFYIVGSIIFFFAFYYHLCCFDVAARRQTFDEYPLFWFEKIDSHERNDRPREHRAVCVNKKQRDERCVFLPLAVSVATYRCKSKKTRKREKMHVVCFTSAFRQQRVRFHSNRFKLRGLWGLKIVESREIKRIFPSKK